MLLRSPAPPAPPAQAPATPTLTGVVPDPHQPGYQVVELDRERFASLPAEALAALAPLGLALGAPLTPKVLARLTGLAELEDALRAALRALGRRGHARADLRRRLLGRRHPAAAVDAALERLAARGLLDDRRFAEHRAAARAARGTGPARLVTDLLAQGVDRATADAAVRQAFEDEALDPAAQARAVAAKRARQLGDLPAPVRRRRLLAFLARRGFAGAAVRALVDELTRG